MRAALTAARPNHPPEDQRISTVNDKGNRRNEDIRVPRVRVIDAEGEQAGILTRAQALAMAEEAGMDLVEIQPNADPPVCRIMDYGKYRFELQKKANAARKKQKQVEIKEVKFRPTTDEGDYQIKLRNLVRFLTEGDKTKITLRFRGREMAHQELGVALLKRVEADLLPYGQVEQWPKMEGRQMIMILAPKKKH